MLYHATAFTFIAAPYMQHHILAVPINAVAQCDCTCPDLPYFIIITFYRYASQW